MLLAVNADAAFLALLGQLLVAVVAGAVGALIAAPIALRQFYKQQWWDKKRMLYTEMIEILHQMKRRSAIEQRAFDEGYQLEDEFSKELHENYWAARDQLRQLSDIAELFLSADTVSVLKTCERNLVDVNIDAEWWYDEVATLNQALDRIIDLARKDLGVAKK